MRIIFGSEVNKVIGHLIACVCTIAGKLERVVCLWLVLVPSPFDLIDMAAASRMAVALCLCAVGMNIILLDQYRCSGHCLGAWR